MSLTYFLVVRANSEPSLFGTNLSMLELVPELGWRIPPCLVTLKRHLLELGGLSCEGIFRVSASEEDVLALRQQVNQHQPLQASSPHAVATPIKQFYRDLPDPVLSEVPTTIILAQDQDPTDMDIKTCMNRVREPNRSAFDWFIDLMADVALRELENKMNAKVLATCTSANLYGSPQVVLNPEHTLLVTQKFASFVAKLIFLRMHAKRCSLSHAQ